MSFFLPVVLVATVIGAKAETHTVLFQNNCGFGTPILIQGPNVLSTGGNVTFQGPLISAIAYLQTGGCGFNGEGCTLIETTLINPNNGPGSGSSTDITSHAFSVASGFGYFGGDTGICNGFGADCTIPSCPTGFLLPGDTDQVACQDNNVNLAIVFCE